MAVPGKGAHNERVKLTATWLNGLSIAVFAIGVAAPVLPALSAGTLPARLSAIGALTCFALSLGLHLIARRRLKGIIE